MSVNLRFHPLQSGEELGRCQAQKAFWWVVSGLCRVDLSGELLHCVSTVFQLLVSGKASGLTYVPNPQTIKPRVSCPLRKTPYWGWVICLSSRCHRALRETFSFLLPWGLEFELFQLPLQVLLSWRECNGRSPPPFLNLYLVKSLSIRKPLSCLDRLLL